MNPKPWWLSKTLWVSILTTVAGVIGVLLGQEWIQDHPQIVSVATIILGLVNAFLRAITDTKLAAGKSMKILLPLALLLLPGAAWAEDLVITGLTPGRHYLRVDVSTAGATVARLRPVDVSGTPPPVDPPPVTPPPGGLTGTAKLAFDEAAKINRPQEAAVLAATYQAIADQIRGGTLSVAEAGKHASTAVDLVLSAMGAKDRWQPWRQAIAAHLTAQRLSTAEQFAAAYDALSQGLQSSAGGAESAIDFRVILKLIIAIVSKDPAAFAQAVIELLESLRRP